MISTLNFRQQADSTYGVLINGIMVIHIELHLRDNATEIGNESSKNSCFVHPPQNRLRVVGRCQNIDEQDV